MRFDINSLKVFYAFSEEPGEIHNDNVYFPKDRTPLKRGMPLESDLLQGYNIGKRYCALMWMTPGYSVAVIDHLDLNKYFYSK